MYFLDTGLAAYLTRHATAEQLEVSYMNGAFLETYVLCEILKSYWLNAKEAPLYFYRASAKKEIDFIIDFLLLDYFQLCYYLHNILTSLLSS